MDDLVAAGTFTIDLVPGALRGRARLRHTAGLSGLLGEVDLQGVDGVHEVTLRGRHP